MGPSLIDKSAADIHLMLDTGRMPADVPYVDEIHERPRFTFVQMSALVSYIQSFSVHPDTTLPMVMPANPVRGRLLYIQNCGVCHGAAGDGSSVGSDDVAPSLRHATVFQVAEAIRAGPGVMPRFGPRVLRDDDMDAIARYVNTLQANAGLGGDDRGGISLDHAGPVAEGLVAWIVGLGLVVLCAYAIAKSSAK